jgi:hypothetical protein
MERNEFCPLRESCSIYQNKVQHNEMVGLTYQALYCTQVNKKYKACRRYQLCQELGMDLPHRVLPNSCCSREEVSAGLAY